ncbi:MAG: tRNA 4-thiouridine(8) synthase ThiI [Clostridia bacterium]|nr:tRNA 4-thiouridine(8) synthase ThiI [Clostridia bacterium]
MNGKIIFLCKYGEIVLKGANRSSFESMLVRELRFRLERAGRFSVTRGQSVIYVEPADGASDGEICACERVLFSTFGINAVCRAVTAEKDYESIRRTAVEGLAPELSAASSFKVETKRADKRFPMRSAEISARLGGDLLAAYPNLRVDVKNPDVTVKCDVREESAFLSAGQKRSAGGMPAGSNGRALLLLSGGIDSPVAGWMAAKRGLKLDAVYFEAFPYTSELARQKVVSLASILAGWAGSISLHVISLTEIEETISRECREEYFTLILRRFMMKIASRAAEAAGCGGLVTGDSLGQVASQTLEAIAVSDDAASLPILRPCIGLDKEDIISVARRIGSFDTSVLPYEDCCTVFTPRHPKTRPALSAVLAEEEKLDCERLISEALASDTVLKIRYEIPVAAGPAT